MYSGKGAREDAAKELTDAVLSWRNDQALEVRGEFRGFAILSRGKAVTRLLSEEQPVPELFLRGAGTWAAHLNPDNPLGTVQSIEHTLRALDRAAAQEEDRIGHIEKTLADYQVQANRPFEHEQHLKELLARQAQLNAALDLDKGESQVAEAAESADEAETGTDPARPQGATGISSRRSTAALRQ